MGSSTPHPTPFGGYLLPQGEKGFSAGRSRPVAVWLFAVAALVFALVVVGGATRLTGSGLSITQWKPVSGILPPMSQRAWASAFALYRAIPQYRLVNAGMTLGAFKVIFWWEWAHRLLGRLVGAAFAVPFAAFLAMRRLPRRLAWRCAGLLGLGALQGLVGWWMVKSGLETRVLVAPERLATHLGLALVLFTALIWTGLEAWFGQAEGQRRDRWTTAGAIFAGGVFLQCLLGALVAGNIAGLIDSDWPRMAGAWVPVDYWRGALWATLAHGQAAVQFNHRLVAYGLAVLGLALAFKGARARKAPQFLRALAIAAGGAVSLQAALGVATLVTGVPLILAIAHQAGAAMILGIAACLAWRTRRI
jgi:cytochrome c oxidase assembly protein subunit 15